jgi:hypothetical protein
MVRRYKYYGIAFASWLSQNKKSMRNLIIALATFITMSSVSLAPQVEQKDSLVNYRKDVVGEKIVLVDTTATSQLDSATVELLLPKEKKSLLPKALCPKFKSKMGHLESGGNYKAINQYGYLGKYQFSKRTLRRLVEKGYLQLTKEEIRKFRELPYIQEMAMDALIAANLETLRNWKLNKYVGKDIGGVKVTMEGMLAASHLLGPYAVKHYLQHNGSMDKVIVGGVTVRKYDANGTSLKKYLRHFA